VDEKMVQMILHEYKIFNAEVSLYVVCFIFKWLREAGDFPNDGIKYKVNNSE
jgi:hypothetical protein